jgi:hypothetical protein
MEKLWIADGAKGGDFDVVFLHTGAYELSNVGFLQVQVKPVVPLFDLIKRKQLCNLSTYLVTAHASRRAQECDYVARRSSILFQ